MSVLVALVIVASMMAGAPARAAQSAVFDWIDWDALGSGEVVSRRGDESKGEVALDVAVLIDAERSSIWQALTECELAPQYVPDVLDCRLLEEVDDGRGRIYVQTVKPMFFLPKFEHVFRLSFFPPERVTIEGVAGGGIIEEMHGEWLIVTRPEGKIAVIQSMRVEPAIPIPKVLVRAALKRNLTKVLSAVKERAEEAAKTALLSSSTRYEY